MAAAATCPANLNTHQLNDCDGLPLFKLPLLEALDLQKQGKAKRISRFLFQMIAVIVPSDSPVSQCELNRHDLEIMVGIFKLTDEGYERILGHLELPFQIPILPVAFIKDTGPIRLD